MLTVKREVISIHLIQSLKTSTGFSQDWIRSVYEHFTSGIILKIVGFRMKECIGVMNHCQTIDCVVMGCGVCTGVSIYGKSKRGVYGHVSAIIDASGAGGLWVGIGARPERCT